LIEAINAASLVYNGGSVGDKIFPKKACFCLASVLIAVEATVQVPFTFFVVEVKVGVVAVEVAAVEAYVSDKAFVLLRFEYNVDDTAAGFGIIFCRRVVDDFDAFDRAGRNTLKNCLWVCTCKSRLFAIDEDGEIARTTQRNLVVLRVLSKD
jgi:hypothetical protein